MEIVAMTAILADQNFNLQGDSPPSYSLCKALTFVFSVWRIIPRHTRLRYAQDRALFLCLLDPYAPFRVDTADAGYRRGGQVNISNKKSGYDASNKRVDSGQHSLFRRVCLRVRLHHNICTEPWPRRLFTVYLANAIVWFTQPVRINVFV